MAQDNVSYLEYLPFFGVSATELHNILGASVLTESDIVNYDFLNNLKSVYDPDVLSYLNFDYFTPDSFNAKIAGRDNGIKFSIFHLNIRSLNKNNEELCQFMRTIHHEFDLIVLSEIWSFNASLYNNLFPGYNFHYDLPSATSVGGVGIYVRNSLSYCIIDEFKMISTSECLVENLWIKVTKGCNEYIIGAVYRHPGYKINCFTEKLDNIFTQITKCNIPCFIVGDVNIDLKKFQSHQETKAYIDNLIINNFTPTVVMPTRITSKSATIIDHIYYTNNGKSNFRDSLTAGNLWCDISDHLPNFLLLECDKSVKYSMENRPFIRLHSLKNLERFRSLIDNIDWSNAYYYSSSNEAYSYFHEKIKDCYIKCFPEVRMSRKCARDKMWITRGIKRSSNHKNKLYKKWVCSRDPLDEKNYKSYLKVFKKVTLAAQMTYYKDKFDIRINTTKQLWINLNKVCSLNKNKTTTCINKMIFDNKEISEPSEICNKLNNYFCSIGTNLVQLLNPGGNIDFMKYTPYSNKNSMFCSPVTPDEIVKIIQRLPNNKAPGMDGINSKILKVICNSISPPLAHIFNLSFTTGEVPELLKVAKVIPIYKKGERNQPGNYRPISLLSIFDKIMEKLMYKRLSDFLENNNILYEYQFGFRKNHSTSHAVMEVMDSIYQNWDNHDVTMGIFLDLQKAFDTVNHYILLKKLEIYGIRGIILKWFTSYLTNRRQYTVLQNYESEFECITYGVPQGSVLGPLLFLIYVNDIQYAITNAKIKLFADDTNVFFHSKDLVKLFTLANAGMLQLYDWFKVNKLSLNVDKTCYSVFGPNCKKDMALTLHINGKAIQNVTCCKYLGIMIDNDLKWKKHIDYVYNKLIKFVSIFYKIRTKVCNNILRMIYFAFVHSHLLYGVEVYANTTTNHLSKLITLNNKLLRILQNKSIKTHNSELYRTYFTLPLQLLHNFQILLFIHKYVHHRSKLPDVFSTYFEPNKVLHSHDTRQKNDFHMYAVQSEVGKKIISYKGTKLWNNLPDDIKQITSPLRFKYRLKCYMLQSLE